MFVRGRKVKIESEDTTKLSLVRY